MPISRLLRDMLKRYLFGNDNTDYLVVIIAKHLYPNEVFMIKKGICPWCRKRFRHLKSHLIKGKECGLMFKEFLDDVVQVYFNFKNSIYYRHSKKHHCSYVILKGIGKYRTMKEALKVYLMNVKH